MSKWECIVCGWVYDEAIGDPDSGIAPGTRWEDVPEDWVCPDCGVGKDDFELLVETEETSDVPHHDGDDETDHSAAPIIILGTGLAGYNLAREFRKHDAETPLIIISADDGRPYSKPMLSTGYTKNTEAADLAQTDAGTMARQLRASVWTMTRVVEIDTKQQLIKVGDAATSIHYSKLVLALGASTITPPIKGDALDHVYGINDLLDFDDFRKSMKKTKAKKVCIIGGGLIGCEYTNDLINGGYEVETVDPLDYCLPTLLPEAAGRAVQNALEAKGATFHFGPFVTEVNKADHGVVVSLSTGSTINADLVICAVGVRARTELAAAAGIEVNRGIVANRLLETSANNVYTLGDCAEVGGHNLVYVAPLMAGARALGKTLAGTPTEVSYGVMPVSIKTPACPVVVNPPPIGAAGQWSIAQQDNNIVGEFRDPEGYLLGFALTGEGVKQKVRLQKELPPIMA